MKLRNTVLWVAALLVMLQAGRAATILILTVAFALTVPAQAILSIAAMLLMLGFVVMLAAAQQVDIPLRPKAKTRRGKLGYAAAGVLMVGIVFGISFIDDGVHLESVMSAIYFGLVIPLYEEILFRGYIWQRLAAHKMTPQKIGVFTAAAFALWHIGYWDITVFYSDNAGDVIVYLLTRAAISFVLGLALAWLRAKTKSCYVGLLVHGVMNVLGV